MSDISGFIPTPKTQIFLGSIWGVLLRLLLLALKLYRRWKRFMEDGRSEEANLASGADLLHLLEPEIGIGECPFT